MIAGPSKWSKWLLRKCLNHNFLEEIEGDMEEEYWEIAHSRGVRHARFHYTKNVISLLRPVLLRNLLGAFQSKNSAMVKNNITIAARKLVRQKYFTAINILGLTTGLSMCMLIIVFIIDQDKKDEYHSNANRIYRLLTHEYDQGRERELTYATSPFDLKDALNGISQVEEVAQIVPLSGTVSVDKKKLSFSGLYASPNFPGFFELTLEGQDNISALRDDRSVILTKELSVKLFGLNDPLGQNVSIDGKDYIVRSIFDHSSFRSHLTFDLLIPLNNYTRKPQNQLVMKEWEQSTKTFYNYVRLPELHDQTELNSVINSVDNQFPEIRQAHYRFDSQRLDQINLGSVVQNEIGLTVPKFVVYFFMVLGTVLILSASFNYMNMSIALGLKRAREVGIRKTMGAQKGHIITQFLIESYMITVLSFVLSLLVLTMLIPVFNNLKILRDIEGAIQMNYYSNFTVYLSFFFFTIIVGTLSGLYPALHVASFGTIKSLKGGNLSNGKSPSFLFRKMLVFFQYGFSIIFIITTVILYEQVEILVNFDYGFSEKQMINLPKNDLPLDAFRDELLKQTSIESVSSSSNIPMLSTFEVRNIKTFEKETQASLMFVDPYMIENYGLTLISGRNFNPQLPSDRNQKIILNLKAIKTLGFESPDKTIHQVIQIEDENDTDRSRDYTVIGVLSDFNHDFIFKESGPLIMIYNPDRLTEISIRTASISVAEATRIIEKVWSQFDSSGPFTYQSFEYQISDIYDELKELMIIVGFVAFMAIVIACLGQLSMIAHHVQLKVKEIGIRKVLGAKSLGLMVNLTKGYLLIIGLSILTSAPIAWKINDFWTTKIEVAPEVDFWNFSFGLVIVVGLALTTIATIVYRATNANPIESLNYE
jgi:putative ABC transport system permease protein